MGRKVLHFVCVDLHDLEYGSINSKWYKKSDIQGKKSVVEKKFLISIFPLQHFNRKSIFSFILVLF